MREEDLSWTGFERIKGTRTLSWETLINLTVHMPLNWINEIVCVVVEALKFEQTSVFDSCLNMARSYCDTHGPLDPHSIP